jgi:hypothetical protein
MKLLDNILMINLSEKGDFSNGGGGETLIHSIKSNSLEGNSLVIPEIDCPTDNAICTLADSVELVVMGKLGLAEVLVGLGVGG